MPDPRDEVLQYITNRNFGDILGHLLRKDTTFKGVRFTQVHPKIEGEVPCIVWRRIRRTPGVEGVEQYGGRIRREIKFADSNQVTSVYSQWHTSIYQFDCCARSSTEAENLLSNFEDFMEYSKGLLISLGLNKLYFDEELKDDLLPGTRDVEVRSIRYLTVLERLSKETHPVMEQVLIRIISDISFTNEEVTRSSDPDDLSDVLLQTFITSVHIVANPSTTGIALQRDYYEGVDYTLSFDNDTKLTKISWTHAGKKPAAGAIYIVTYRFWSGNPNIKIPIF